MQERANYFRIEIETDREHKRGYRKKKKRTKTENCLEENGREEYEDEEDE